MLLYVFFFFKQKSAYEFRISDWSSDVCSSDLSMDYVREHVPRHRPRRIIHRVLRGTGIFHSRRFVQDLRSAGQADAIVNISSFHFGVNALVTRIMMRPRAACGTSRGRGRSEEHTSELQSLMRISYAVF